jgi:hypothetical protein
VWRREGERMLQEKMLSSFSSSLSFNQIVCKCVCVFVCVCVCVREREGVVLSSIWCSKLFEKGGEKRKVKLETERSKKEKWEREKKFFWDRRLLLSSCKREVFKGERKEGGCRLLRGRRHVHTKRERKREKWEKENEMLM